MMVTVQLALTGVNVFYKLAGNNGISLRVLIAYRFLFAAATVVPLALIFERKNRPKLTWKIAFQAFLSALFGMERLGLNTRAGKAKVMGTLMGIGGAMVLTFYKGCEVNIWSTHFNLMHKNQQSGGHVAAAHHKSFNNILGPLLALACCFSVSLSLIVQGLEPMETWVEPKTSYSCLHGNFGIRNNVGIHHVMCKDERAIICLGFQSVVACAGGAGRIFAFE
ncbi:hypothetical protein DH2020_044943 [Rehmannia glutinosa]|uniref:WAT1-related protein n=1 Tax=Rehmannia glutinosa TaxID=99300 RepID=A0ABR0UG89_REHGL